MSSAGPRWPYTACSSWVTAPSYLAGHSRFDDLVRRMLPMSATRQMAILGALAQLAVTGMFVSAHGQMESGSRIRVTTDSGSRVGTLISAATDSIWLVSAKDSMALVIPTQSVVRLEHSLGQQPATGRGALIGALIGS